MNAKGEVVAQHVVLPLHIGAFRPAAARSSPSSATPSRRATPS